MTWSEVESPRKRLRISATVLLWSLFAAMIVFRLALAGINQWRASRERAEALEQQPLATVATWTPGIQLSAVEPKSPSRQPEPPTAIAPSPSPMPTNAPAPIALIPLTTLSATPSPPPTSTPTPIVTPSPVPTWPSTPSGAIGRIVIPSLERNAPIVPVSWHMEEVGGQKVAVWDTVSGAAGHHIGSAPLGGPGNTVLSGHTGGRNGGVFNGLWNLRVGDEVLVVDAEGQEHPYLVQETITLQEVGASIEDRLRNAQAMAPSEDTRLTLITCWPEWVYTHRVIVVARPLAP